jgi:PhzF family phenazine biosynthesis protein
VLRRAINAPRRRAIIRTQLFQIDAFTNQRFAGNPAAVMPLERFPSDDAMQAIAAENNLAETAFVVPENGDYRIRWFTPTVEVPLCGHATLASAAVVMEKLEPKRNSVVFHSASGPLKVDRAEGSRYVMDFPARYSEEVSEPPDFARILGVQPVQVFANTFNYMVVLNEAKTVRELSPDLSAVAQLGRDGVIVTATGDEGYDIISRYFAPAKGVDEDPVTGSAHCMLAPFWAERLDKNELRAWQASPRGGEVICRVHDDRVELEGECVFYLEGEAEI